MYILIYILVIAIVIAVSTKRPAIALAFLLCTYGFEQWLQSRDVFFLINTSLANIVTGVVVLYALATKIFKEKNVFGKYPTEAWLIILLYFYAAASFIWSPVPDISFENILHYLPYIVLMTGVAPFLVTTSEDIYKSQLFLVILGGVLIVLLLFFTEWRYRTIALVIENTSTTVDLRANPLAIANMAGYVMLTTVLLNVRNKNKLWNYSRWILVVFCLAVAVKTGSRGQFLFMLITALLFLPVSKSISHVKKLLPILVAMSFVSAVAFWAMEEYSGEDTRWGSDRMGEDLGGRYEAASNLIEQWYSSPQTLFFGLGSSASYDKSIFGFYTHIVPLEILGELGLIGFAVFLVILFLSVRNYRRNLKKLGKNDVTRGVFASIGALVFFEFMLSFKQGSFLSSQILFGLLIVMARLNYQFSIKNNINNENSLVSESAKFESDKSNSVRLKR